MNKKYQVGQEVICSWGSNKGKPLIIKTVVYNGYHCVSANEEDDRLYYYKDNMLQPK